MKKKEIVKEIEKLKKEISVVNASGNLTLKTILSDLKLIKKSLGIKTIRKKK
jgi:hypothetical protein